jgi:hypothetical protein
MIRRLIFAAALLSTPALADTVTLQIENDAGMVTTREGYTQTECDAAALLLNGAKDTCTGSCITGLIIGNGTPYINGYQPPPQPHTPKLTKAQCMRPTQGTKP